MVICSQPRNKMQKLLEKFIGRTSFCQSLCSSEIAILHLAQCPIEIIISQTIAVVSFNIVIFFCCCSRSISPLSSSAHEKISMETFSILLHIAVLSRKLSTNPLIDRFSFRAQCIKIEHIDAWKAILAGYFFPAIYQNQCAIIPYLSKSLSTQLIWKCSQEKVGP